MSKDSDLWYQYALQIQQYLSNGGKFDATSEIISMKPLYTYARYASMNPAVTTTSDQVGNFLIDNVANVLPSVGPGFASTGLVTTGLLTYLDNVDLQESRDGLTLQQYATAKAALDGAQQNYNSISDQALTAYVAHKKALVDAGETNIPKYADWARDNYPRVQAALDNLDGIAITYYRAQQAVYGKNFVLMQRWKKTLFSATSIEDNIYTMPAATSELTWLSLSAINAYDDPAKPQQVLPFTFKPSCAIPQFRERVDTWVGSSGDSAPEFQVEFSHTSVEKTDFTKLGYTATQSGGGGGVFAFPIFAFGEQSQSSTTDWKSIGASSDTTTVDGKISFAHFGVFDIVRNTTWWDPSLLQQPLKGVNRKAFLAKNLPAYTTKVVLGFNPTIDMTFDQKTFRELHANWITKTQQKNVAGISIFGFTFGHESTTTTQTAGSFGDVAFDEPSNGVKVKLQTNLPCLIATISQKTDGMM